MDGEIGFFPSSGDEVQDARAAAAFAIHDRRIKQGLCPNGCGPMVQTSANEMECPKCPFTFWSNVPLGEPEKTPE